MSKIKESNKKFRICDLKLIQDENGNEGIDVNFNKALIFENEEVESEVLRITEEYIENLKGIILD